MRIQPLRSDTYYIAIDASSKAATLDKAYGVAASAFIYNDSDKCVFVVDSNGTMTIAAPASATVPVKGKMIPAKSGQTFDLAPDATHIYAIQPSAGTGGLYISIDAGGGV